MSYIIGKFKRRRLCGSRGQVPGSMAETAVGVQREIRSTSRTRKGRIRKDGGDGKLRRVLRRIGSGFSRGRGRGRRGRRGNGRIGKIGRKRRMDGDIGSNFHTLFRCFSIHNKFLFIGFCFCFSVFFVFFVFPVFPVFFFSLFCFVLLFPSCLLLFFLLLFPSLFGSHFPLLRIACPRPPHPHHFVRCSSWKKALAAADEMARRFERGRGARRRRTRLERRRGMTKWC
mmetsp:Transcript_31826/g.57855  ORF Transcript_31826/g.57855 Transcript_31826/m.57855 type:complete len:228 (+) Transcript_31826:312-995(+)